MQRHMYLSLLLVLGLALNPLCVADDSANNSTTSTPSIGATTGGMTAGPTSGGSNAAGHSPSPGTTETASESTSTSVSPPENTTQTSDDSSVATASVSGTTTTQASPIVTSGSASVTELDTTTVNTTLAPEKITTTTAATTTSVPEITSLNVTAAGTASTSEMTMSSTTAEKTTSTASAPTTMLPEITKVWISETNLLLFPEDLFVELKGTVNKSLEGLTLVVLDGTSAMEKVKIDFNSNDEDIFSTPEMTKPIESEKVKSLKLVVVALYNSSSYNSSTPYKDFVDFTILSTDASAQLDPSLKEAMLSSGYPLVAKAGLSTSQNLSLSRCGGGQKNESMLVLSAQTPGKANTCNLTRNGTVYTLQLQKKGDNCESQEAGETPTREVHSQLVWEINKRCQCGLTNWLLNGSLSCARDLYFDFSIKESYEGQAEQVITAFTAFTRDNQSLTVNKLVYSVANCTRNCRSSAPHHQSDSKNTSVTVAVVLSCVALFLIILVSVILYMRGKRKGIIRQFRMTRLQEDDDMDDMEDFMGGGEASFNARS